MFAFSFITFCVFRYSPLVTHVIFHILTEPVNIDIEKNIYSGFNNLVRAGSLSLVLIAGAMILFSAVKAGYIRTLIEKSTKIKIDKITTKYFEVNLSDKNEKSVFGRYIDEILYFFIQTNTKIVVFEDIDRFSKEEVFLHLKEVNHILNNYACHNNLEKITFIYAVKEDLFDTDKTNNLLSIVKFFDFCMPIIPFGNRLNIGNMLVQLKNENLFEERYACLNDEILIKLGSLIDETRLYTNIINEYEVYTYKLQNNPCLNYQELFSLLVIKNIDIKSFKSLEARTESVNELLKFKEKMIDLIMKEKIKNKLEIDKKEQEFNEMIDYEIQDIKEKYLTKFANQFPEKCNNLTDVAGLRQEYPKEMNSLIEKGKATIADDFDEQGNPESVQQISIDKDAFNTFQINGNTYSTVIDYFRDREDISNQKYEIDLDKEKYQKEMDFLNSASFYKIIDEYPDVIIKLENENEESINKEKTIYRYLKEGIISEEYPNCISYFKDGYLSKNDTIFINFVKNNVGDSDGLELTNFEQVINELSEKDSYSSVLLNEKILNYSLLNYLCVNRLLHNNSRILSDFLTYIFKQKKGEFIFQCIKKYQKNEVIILLSIFLLSENDFFPFISKNYDTAKHVEIFKNVLSCDFGHEIYRIKNPSIINFVKNNKDSLLNANTKKNINLMLLHK